MNCQHLLIIDVFKWNVLLFAILNINNFFLSKVDNWYLDLKLNVFKFIYGMRS
jgi:hypothetical protein